ncbi:hypothetical protein EDD11_005938 [Mortierella claussenii]|nr:hypothetical protein EDD11_005938 [Mortierella claussenii]
MVVLAFKKDPIKSAPGWNPDNATESEAEVKADREPMPSHVKELQDETVETIIEKHGETFRHSRTVGKDGVTTEDLHIKVEELEDELGQKLGKDMNGKGEKIIDKWAHRAQEAGEKLGKTTGAVKGRVDHAEGRIEDAGDTVVDEVKLRAQKVTSFVKDSLDSVKKTVGLNGKETAKKTKKTKHGDDRVDSDPPEFEAAGKTLKEYAINVARVGYTIHSVLYRTQGITSYPTLKIYQ